MFGLEYVQQAQDWMKGNALRRVTFCMVTVNPSGEARFLLTLEEGGKVLASATGATLAEATKNVASYFKNGKQ